MNGTSANLGEFPWQAQIIRSWDKAQFCGGTLISSKHVLTAAHCIILPKENIEVITGRLSKYEDEPQQVTSKVAKISMHSDYRPETINNDIALLELVEPVPFNKHEKGLHW